jgi:voltage-gated potassium channel
MISSTWRIIRRALNRTWFVIILIISFWLAAGLLFSLIEGTNVFEGLWWASVTGSTTGYGDYYPETIGGRVLGGLFMVSSMILTAFFTAHVVSAVIEDKNKFTHSEQERHEAALLLIGKSLGIFEDTSKQLPSLEEFKKLGFKESPDED